MIIILKDLLDIIVGGDTRDDLGPEFIKMVSIADEMFRETNLALWNGTMTDELRKSIYKKDVRINKIERGVRKMALNLLALQPESGAVPYCFVLINVVKDAERIGDYVKNLSEVQEIGTGDLPAGELREQLRQLGLDTEGLLGRVGSIFKDSDRDAAEESVRRGRELGKIADALLPEIAKAGFDSKATTAMVMMTRFYKRIAAHSVNICSSVIMPLHKIDYFDEDEL